MMATFMAIMIPRAAVCAERIARGARHRSSVRAAGDAGRRRRRRAASWSSTDVEFRYPGAATPVLRDISLPRAARADDGDHRQHRRRQDDADLAGAAAVRRDRRARSWSTASTCATSTRRRSGSRIGLVPQKAVPVHRHGREQPALRQPGRHRRRAVGGARGRPGRATSSRRCPAGWTPRSPRAAPTSPAASASGWRSPGRWCAGPRSTCSTTRSPRSTSPPTPGCGPRSARAPARRRCVIVAQRVSTIADADQIIVLEDGADRRHRHATTSCSPPAPTYQEIVESQLSLQEAA